MKMLLKNIINETLKFISGMLIFFNEHFPE